MVQSEGHSDPVATFKSGDPDAAGKRSQDPDPNVNFAELLHHRPPPLINPPAGYGVLWSAKAGSKAVMFWFLCRLGLLEQARNYPYPGRPKPHEFRNRVLSKTPDYKQWLETCDPVALKWLRVIRNPYNRAVSSYRHALGNGYEDRKIEKCMGLSVPDRGLSFDEFLDYLLAIDIADCNNHHRQQWHPIEEHVTLYKVVNIDKESLLPALDAFEAEIGLTPVSPEAREGLLAEWQRDSRRFHKRPETANEDCAEIRFTRGDPKRAWPGYEAFLNADARRKIERIYAKDFAAYADFL